MVGVICFAQGAHYPLLARVPVEALASYETANIRLTSRVVAAPMLAEALTCLLLLRCRPPRVSTALVWSGAGLLAAVWLSTALIQYPQHRALAAGFDPDALRRLVLYNWIRTAAWGLRGVLVLRLLWAAWA